MYMRIESREFSWGFVRINLSSNYVANDGYKNLHNTICLKDKSLRFKDNVKGESKHENNSL